MRIKETPSSRSRAASHAELEPQRSYPLARQQQRGILSIPQRNQPPRFFFSSVPSPSSWRPATRYFCCDETSPDALQRPSSSSSGEINGLGLLKSWKINSVSNGGSCLRSRRRSPERERESTRHRETVR